MRSWRSTGWSPTEFGGLEVRVRLRQAWLLRVPADPRQDVPEYSDASSVEATEPCFAGDACFGPAALPRGLLLLGSAALLLLLCAAERTTTGCCNDSAGYALRSCRDNGQGVWSVVAEGCEEGAAATAVCCPGCCCCAAVPKGCRRRTRWRRKLAARRR